MPNASLQRKMLVVLGVLLGVLLSHLDQTIVDTAFLKERLGIAGASDQELVEVLRARVGDAVTGYSASGCVPCLG